MKHKWLINFFIFFITGLLLVSASASIYQIYKSQSTCWIETTETIREPQYVCSYCGEYGMDWMEYCPNCGRHIVRIVHYTPEEEEK